MAWRLIERPMVAAAYAVNLAVRAQRAVIGPKRHKGTAAEIIRACIDDCWDGTHYRASPGHFRQFWTRDLSFSAPALARLSPKHRERVIRSFEWAIRTWERRRSHVTTTIHFFDQPVDVFDYGVDCLPLMLAVMRRIGAVELLEAHRPWLEGEVRHYMDEVVDPRTGMGAEVQRLIRSAIRSHFALMQSVGEPIPLPSTLSDTVGRAKLISLSSSASV